MPFYPVVGNGGMTIELSLPMDVHKVSANDKVAADVNHLAVERGPIVYCAEFADNGGTVLNYVLKPETAFELLLLLCWEVWRY